MSSTLSFPSGKTNPSPRIYPRGRAKQINLTILNRLTFSTVEEEINYEKVKKQMLEGKIRVEYGSFYCI